VVSQGLENIIRGITVKKSNAIDLKYVDGIRNVRRRDGVVDILSLDILRGRLNGVPTYPKFIESLGADNRGIYSSPNCPADLDMSSSINQIDPIACFIKIVAKDIDSPSEDELKVAGELQDAYGKVLHVDAIVGLLAEPHSLGGVSFSKNIAEVTADQFKRSRDGDRFWFENNEEGQFLPEELAMIKDTTMKDLFVRNFDITVLPDDVFAGGDNWDQVFQNCGTA
jgi:peroxidase